MLYTLLGHRSCLFFPFLFLSEANFSFLVFERFLLACFLPCMFSPKSMFQCLFWRLSGGDCNCFSRHFLKTPAFFGRFFQSMVCCVFLRLSGEDKGFFFPGNFFSFFLKHGLLCTLARKWYFFGSFFSETRSEVHRLLLFCFKSVCCFCTKTLYFLEYCTQKCWMVLKKCCKTRLVSDSSSSHTVTRALFNYHCVCLAGHHCVCLPGHYCVCLSGHYCVCTDNEEFSLISHSCKPKVTTASSSDNSDPHHSPVLSTMRGDLVQAMVGCFASCIFKQQDHDCMHSTSHHQWFTHSFSHHVFSECVATVTVTVATTVTVTVTVTCSTCCASTNAHGSLILGHGRSQSQPRSRSRSRSRFMFLQDVLLK